MKFNTKEWSIKFIIGTMMVAILSVLVILIVKVLTFCPDGKQFNCYKSGCRTEMTTMMIGDVMIPTEFEVCQHRECRCEDKR
jgi:hypothetical protein